MGEEGDEEKGGFERDGGDREKEDGVVVGVEGGGCV